MKHFPALTLIELLIVIAVVGVVSIPGFMAVANIRSRQSLGTSAEVLANTLKKAHIFAREARDDASWGVTNNGKSEYSLIKRNDMGESKSDTIRLESPTEISSNFSIWFKQDSGDTDMPSTVRLTSNGKIADIVVNKSGVVEVK